MLLSQQLVLVKSVSPISSEVPEILDSHLGGIASCCSHHSSSCKEAEIGNGGAPLPRAPSFLLQAPRRVLAPSSAHQGGLHFHTGTGQELGTGSQSRMVLAGRSTAGPETSLHGRCSANRALCELAVPGPGLCAHQHCHQSDAQSSHVWYPLHRAAQRSSPGLVASGCPCQ